MKPILLLFHRGVLIIVLNFRYVMSYCYSFVLIMYNFKFVRKFILNFVLRLMMNTLCVLGDAWIKSAY